MDTTQNLSNLISSAVAAKMTPELIEKEVHSRVEKLIVESVNLALRSHSETGKLIEKAVADSLRVDRLDLPSYGDAVLKILKVQIESRVSDLVAGKLAQDMDELLKLAPKEIKLSMIAKDMIERFSRDGGCGDVISIIVEKNDHGYASIYLDEYQVYPARDKYRCRHHLHIDKEGKIYSASLDGRDLKDTKHIGRAYGLSQQIRAWVACGTTIILDEDDVVTSVGDY